MHVWHKVDRLSVLKLRSVNAKECWQAWKLVKVLATHARCLTLEIQGDYMRLAGARCQRYLIETSPKWADGWKSKSIFEDFRGKCLATTRRRRRDKGFENNSEERFLRGAERRSRNHQLSARRITHDGFVEQVANHGARMRLLPKERTELAQSKGKRKKNHMRPLCKTRCVPACSYVRAAKTTHWACLEWS